jgi:hypothetical protein
MKKTLTIIALAGLFVGALFAAETKTSSWIDGLSVNSSVGFESEYVYRGRNIAHNVAVWTLNGSYKLYKGSLYAGAIGYNGQDATYTENDLYLGYKLPVYEKFSADFGGTYYWYTNQGTTGSTAFPTGNIDNTFELYTGVIYNGLWVNPAAYVYYDFMLRQFVVEASGKYSWDLAKYGVANTALDVGAAIGWLNSEDANGDTVAGKPHNGYTYYGVNADVVYSFNKNASASVGIGYAGNDDEAQKVTSNKLFARENNFFWSAKFSAGF